MDVFTMVAVIVVAACAASVASSYLKGRARNRPQKPDADVQRAIEDLRRRVEVLEKIVTDDGYQLAREIDVLGNDRRGPGGAGRKAEDSG